MNSKLSDIEASSRIRLVEITPRYWTSAELQDIIVAGIRDLWRDIADLKQEHFLTVNNTDVYLEQDSITLSGVPLDVHKIYLIEARDLSVNGSNVGLQFMPLDYNHRDFRLARSRDAIMPQNDTFYYSITAAGGPVSAPVIFCAPKVTTRLDLSFSYIPTLGSFIADDFVPIPGECDNALIAWTVAYARGKETDDRSPDPNWLSIYSTEKQHLLESLGLRQYQEPLFVDAMWSEYW